MNEACRPSQQNKKQPSVFLRNKQSISKTIDGHKQAASAQRSISPAKVVKAVTSMAAAKHMQKHQESPILTASQKPQLSNYQISPQNSHGSRVNLVGELLASKRAIQPSSTNHCNVLSPAATASASAGSSIRRKLRPWSTVRNDNKSKQYTTMLRAQLQQQSGIGGNASNSPETPIHLNHRLTNDRIIQDSIVQQNVHLKRQRTAAAETFFSIQNKNSSQGRTNARSSGQHIAGGLTSATTVVSQRKKSTLAKTLTKGTVNETNALFREMSSSQRGGATTLTIQESLPSQQPKTTSMANFNNNLQRRIQLNFSSGKRLKEDQDTSSIVNSNPKIKITHQEAQIDHQMINEQSRCDEMDVDKERQLLEELEDEQLTTDYLGRTAGSEPFLRESSGSKLSSSRRKMDFSNILSPTKGGFSTLAQQKLRAKRHTIVPPSSGPFLPLNETDQVEPIQFVLRLRRPSLPKQNDAASLVKMTAYPCTERLGAVVQIGDDSIQVKCDEALEPDLTQEAVYFKTGQDLVRRFVQSRQNCTVMTYGASGSGKTHTLLGRQFRDYLELDQNQMDESFRNTANASEKEKSRSPFRNFKVMNHNAKKVAALWKTTQSSSASMNLQNPPRLDNETLVLLQRLSQDEGRGLAIRLIQQLFDLIREAVKSDEEGRPFLVSCSFVQILHENVIDLLPLTQDMNQTILQNLPLKDASTPRSNKLPMQSPLLQSSKKIQLTASRVEGLSEYVVSTEWDCLNLLRLGERNRLMRLKQLANLHNDSKRSSSIFQIKLHYKAQSSGKSSYRGGGNHHQTSASNGIHIAKFNLCDLASSEKATAQEQIDARHLVDLTKLTKSVQTVEKVIEAIQSGEMINHVVKESKLTRILADSFKGPKILIATVNPILNETNAESVEKDETIKTLQFIDRIRNKNEVEQTQGWAKLLNKIDEKKSSLWKVKQRPHTAVVHSVASNMSELDLPQANNQLCKQSQEENERRLNRMQKERDDELKMQLGKTNSQKHEQDQEAQQPKGELAAPYLQLAQQQKQRLIEENMRLKAQIASAAAEQSSSAMARKNQNDSSLAAQLNNRPKSHMSPKSRQPGTVTVAIKTSSENKSSDTRPQSTITKPGSSLTNKTPIATNRETYQLLSPAIKSAHSSKNAQNEAKNAESAIRGATTDEGRGGRVGDDDELFKALDQAIARSSFQDPAAAGSTIKQIRSKRLQSSPAYGRRMSKTPNQSRRPLSTLRTNGGTALDQGQKVTFGCDYDNDIGILNEEGVGQGLLAQNKEGKDTGQDSRQQSSTNSQNLPDPDFIKKLAQKAEGEIKEFINYLMERHFPTRAHLQLKGLDIVTWKPHIVPKISFINVDGQTMNTLDTPAREVVQMVTQSSTSEDYYENGTGSNMTTGRSQYNRESHQSSMIQIQEMTSDETDDSDSSNESPGHHHHHHHHHHPRRHHQFDQQGSAVSPTGQQMTQQQRKKLKSQPSKEFQPPVKSELLLKAYSGIHPAVKSQRQPDTAESSIEKAKAGKHKTDHKKKNKHHGSQFKHKNKYFGDGSNILNHKQCNQSSNEHKQYNQRSNEKVKYVGLAQDTIPADNFEQSNRPKRPKRRRIQATGWFSPVPYSDDWMTYGNSIGNGSIIKALPPDKNMKMKRVFIKPPDTFEDFPQKKKEFKLLPDPIQAPKPKLVEPSRGPKISPIQYDMRGRRVRNPTPVKIQQEIVSKPGPGLRLSLLTSTKKPIKVKERQYVPGQFNKVANSALDKQKTEEVEAEQEKVQAVTENIAVSALDMLKQVEAEAQQKVSTEEQK